MTKMAIESKNGRVNAVLPSPPAAAKPKTDTAALKSAERTNNMALSLAYCFWEPWRKSYDTREMLTWHISGRLTHPIPRRPVRRYQNVWHCCHILMSATPAETYEEGCWWYVCTDNWSFNFNPHLFFLTLSHFLKETTFNLKCVKENLKYITTYLLHRNTNH